MDLELKGILIKFSESGWDLIDSLSNVRNVICACSKCYNLSDSDPCSICNDPKRIPNFLMKTTL